MQEPELKGLHSGVSHDSKHSEDQYLVRDPYESLSNPLLRTNTKHQQDGSVCKMLAVKPDDLI